METFNPQEQQDYYDEAKAGGWFDEEMLKEIEKTIKKPP